MEKNNISIRPISPDDLPVCLSVIRASFATVAKDFGVTKNCPKHTAFIPLVFLQTQMQWGGRCLLVEKNTIIGYMSLSKEDDSTYELHNLAVLPACRHRGLGAMLLNHAQQIVRHLGGRMFKIGIIEESTLLKNWYIQHGFIPAGTKKFDHLPFTSGYLEWRNS